MNVLMGAESLRPPLTGIGNYTLNLLREYSRVPDVGATCCFDGHRFLPAADLLAGLDSASAPSGGTRSGVLGYLRRTLRAAPLAYQLKSMVSNTRFKQGAQRCRNFVYHEPNFILRPHDGPSVTTVHDLSFIRHPEFHPAERVAWLSRQLPKTLARADFVITDSEVVRRELISQFNIPSARVRAIYLGADERFMPRSAQQSEAVLAKYGLVHGAYLAYVGTIEPRKGLSILLDAWQRLSADVRRAWPLVIAGAPGWLNADLMARIQVLRAKGEVKFLQFVSAQDLPFIYAGAKTFVFPSLYEGFGLPVLEAMASGVPVICAGGTSMAEFAEDACTLFEAGDAEALTTAISRLLEDSGLHERMVQVGQARASQFSWARCARETLQVYSEAAET
ncbi:glycosyltransferase family 4 protein [Pseudomonas canadensis]|uniref:glycosyltransferase family 4 protein n=1 Tax=Pseudomonas canadensis TaxID=915099 RepID=UPI00048ED41B|nr:glycosyltransferase family 1 protein [Pseudomonas canadensis]WLH28596.1 glycosyltransferase family 1 protein [Pseudomonas canadensis]